MEAYCEDSSIVKSENMNTLCEFYSKFPKIYTEEGKLHFDDLKNLHNDLMGLHPLSKILYYEVNMNIARILRYITNKSEKLEIVNLTKSEKDKDYPETNTSFKCSVFDKYDDLDLDSYLGFLEHISKNLDPRTDASDCKYLPLYLAIGLIQCNPSILSNEFYQK